MSLKFNKTGTIRKLGCGFLFAFHSNYGSILHHIRDKLEKTRMVELPEGEKIKDMYNRLDTIPACDRQTVRQTDG